MNIGYFEWLQMMMESKQEIVNLGFPPVIATLFYERFGKHAFLLAKWYRDYKTSRPEKNWWLYAHNSRRSELDILVQLYQATDSPDNYLKTLEKLELYPDEHEVYDEDYLQEQRASLRQQIEEDFFAEGFFKYNNIVNDIISGKLRDIAPYRKLSFWEAQKKYDAKNIFEDRQPIKTYENGFKWIDVGSRCHLVGSLMSNCGSAGVMGNDKDRTLVVLFDANNKPHVIVTYSPNEKRISGDQGGASSAVKPEYHEYVLDLANTLGARFDADRSKSKLLKMKYLLQGKASNLQKLKDSGLFDEYFSFNIGGKGYYSDSNTAVSKEDARRALQAATNGEIEVKNVGTFVQNLFNFQNEPNFQRFGVNYIPLSRL